ncbi:hypothetical protein [Streptomyces marispadix]|uniref:Uncharacterized protein n=1 Tax=Streptomyces marispadix TaxID=2922868 RepID=A0ABS9T1J0_9ACTN|nr:hypothetical protein [Streptomyces marispadix]MCH6162156.1 hypothetical protein [Streptomyces marispadix]
MSGAAAVVGRRRPGWRSGASVAEGLSWPGSGGGAFRSRSEATKAKAAAVRAPTSPSDAAVAQRVRTSLLTRARRADGGFTGCGAANGPISSAVSRGSSLTGTSRSVGTLAASASRA